MRKDDFKFSKYEIDYDKVSEGYPFPNIIVGNLLKSLAEIDEIEHYRVYVEDSLGEEDQAPYLCADFANSEISDEEMRKISPDKCLNVFYTFLAFPDGEVPRSVKGRMLVMPYIEDGDDEVRLTFYKTFAYALQDIRCDFYNFISFRACMDGGEICL